MSVWNFEFAKLIPGLRAFTTRRGANLGLNTEAPTPEVLEARRRLWAAEGLSLERSIFMRQVHGSGLTEVGLQEAGRGSLELADAIPESDLLHATEKGLLLCVGHADCLALLLAHPQSGELAVGHMGWRGALLGVASKLASSMKAPPQELYAGLSVCLGPCHLELSEPQYRDFSRQKDFERYSSPLKAGHFFLNLWEAAKCQLLEAGLEASQIEVQEECTACHLERNYSYRAESGKTGRMMTCLGFPG